MRALILHDELPPDPRPDELDTLVQADAVEGGLLELGAEVRRAAFSANLDHTARAITAHAPDVVFNLVESVLGRARLVHVAPALFETLGVAFCGAGSEAMLLSTSKLLAKRVMRQAGVPTPAWRAEREPAADRPLPAERWIVKSVHEHGSLGLEADSVVSTTDAAQLDRWVRERTLALGGDCFAEAYVHGREFNLALLAGADGPECLPIPEVLFEGIAADAPRVVGYRAKWAEGSAEWDGTPRRFLEGEPRLAQELAALALATWAAFGLEGWARVDVRVDADGSPFVVDVNANPCLSPDAGFAATLARSGISFADALRRILEPALARV